MGFGSGSGLGTGGAIAISESHTVGFLLEGKKKITDVSNLYQQKTKQVHSKSLYIKYLPCIT